MEHSRRELVRGQLAHRAHTARLIRALREAGVDCVLLKGVSHELWLYPDGGRPPSRDIDVLVEPSQLEEACEAVLTLGMRAARDPLGPRRHGLELEYLPPDGAGLPVELHRSFHFVQAQAERCWAVLTADREQIQIGSVAIDVPSVPARAALLALHAAFHGEPGGWVIEDLRRATEVVAPVQWELAANLAEELDALAAFSSGLRLVPAGAVLADSLGLEGRGDSTLRLHARSGHGPSVRMLEYTSRSPLAWLVRMLVHELIPPAERMRTWYPLARRGRHGLAAAHAVRLVRLGGMSPTLISSWRQAREVGRHQRGL